MGSTLLAECARCRVLVHAERMRATECPRCRGALGKGLVEVGFHDAREVYGAPGDPWLPPRPREVALRCLDGHKARSKEERLVDDWLHAHGVLHEREPKLKGMRPDWRVGGDVYIEYWGLAGQQGYEERRAQKLAMYKRRRLKLVELFPEDLPELDDKLSFLVGLSASRAATRMRLALSES